MNSLGLRKRCGSSCDSHTHALTHSVARSHTHTAIMFSCSLSKATRRNTQTRWRCEWQITTRLSVSTHSTKCHHIKMCARKIKANVHRHSVSPVVGVHVTSALATPANPVHFICSLSPPRCMAINTSGRFRFSSYRSSELLSLDVDVRSQTNPNFFIFICLQKNIRLLQLLFFAFDSMSLHHICVLPNISAALKSCVTFVHSKCKIQIQQQI